MTLPPGGSQGAVAETGFIHPAAQSRKCANSESGKTETPAGHRWAQMGTGVQRAFYVYDYSAEIR